MEFLYVFSIMFLLIFGLTVLVKLIAWAVLTRCSVKHDVFVRSGEDLDGFVASVRRDPHVRRVVILSAGNEWDEDAVRLAEKYGNVSFYNTMER